MPESGSLFFMRSFSIVIALPLIALSFIAGQESIIIAFDPAKLEQEGRILAANAYMLGCVRSGRTNELCRLEADSWYHGIEMIGECTKNKCEFPRR